MQVMTTFKANPNVSEFNDIQGKNLEGKITYNETSVVFKIMTNYKSPGKWLLYIRVL